MDRAEEKAMEAYPPHSALIQPARSGAYFADNHMRDGFIKGYHEAEKDLALTWEDIDKIMQIEDHIVLTTSF